MTDDNDRTLQAIQSYARYVWGLLVNT